MAPVKATPVPRCVIESIEVSCGLIYFEQKKKKKRKETIYLYIVRCGDIGRLCCSFFLKKS